MDSLTINTPAAVKKTRVAFHTLGCKLNFSETASIARDFSEAHYTRVPFEEAADVYVINTCSVTENADKRFKALVQQLFNGLVQLDDSLNCRAMEIHVFSQRKGVGFSIGTDFPCLSNLRLNV